MNQPRVQRDDRIGEELAKVEPADRIDELELEIRILREQLDREMAGRLFAEDLLARGLRFP